MSKTCDEELRFVLHRLLNQCTAAQQVVFMAGYGLVAEIPSGKLSSAVALCTRTVKANREKR